MAASDKLIRDEVEKLKKQRKKLMARLAEVEKGASKAARQAEKQLQAQRKGFEQRLSDLEKKAKKTAKSAEKEIAGLRAQVERLLDRQKDEPESPVVTETPTPVSEAPKPVSTSPKPVSKPAKAASAPKRVAPVGKTEGALEELTVAQLRARARQAKISGYSSMTKVKLIAALRDA